MSICRLGKVEELKHLEQAHYDYLNSLVDFSNQMIAMVDILQLTKEELQHRKTITTDIKRVLRKYYPDCEIVPFGSSASGFGFQGCDLDLLFLPFPEYCNVDFKDSEAPCPKPFQILERKVPREYLKTLNESNHLKLVQKIMYGMKYLIKKVIYIPAKCPILHIEFVHFPISCDFSSSNRLVQCNTELLELYGRMDERVRAVTMVLRYWAKCLGLISKSNLSSYAFTFLVIYYLQNTDPPIIPSVKFLIELSEYSYKIDNWEVAVCSDLNLLPRSNNYESVGQLLAGFYEFYWSFDFIHYIVSPHLGKPIHVKELRASSDDRIKEFQVNSFSIQDPFILSRNISRNANMKNAFTLCLKIARRLMQETDFSFQKLFDYSVYEEKLNKMFEPTLKDFDKTSFISCVSLDYEMCSLLDSSNELFSWYDKVCETVLDVLQYALLLDCEIIDKTRFKTNSKHNPRKKRKLNQGEINSLTPLMSIQCAAYYNSWENRRKHVENKSDKVVGNDKDNEVVGIEDDSEVVKNENGNLKKVPLSTLEKEHCVSKLLCQGNVSPTPFMWFFCNCYAHSSLQLSDVILIFSPLVNTSSFCAMTSFLKAYVPKHVKLILREKLLRSKC